jgi:hypothetical protein
MALIVPSSRCAICDELLGGRDYLATSGVFFPPDDPLSSYCDAPLHWDCYEHWPERARFARAYVSANASSVARNEYWGLALLTDLVCLIVRKKEPGETRVWMVETGTCVSIALASWSAWLSDITLAEKELHRLELTSLSRALPDLQRRFPTSNAVVASIDWDAKQRLHELEEGQCTSDASIDALQAHNEAGRRLYAARDAQGLTCPHCRRQSADIEFVDRAADERMSCFVCRLCGRSFGHHL